MSVCLKSDGSELFANNKEDVYMWILYCTVLCCVVDSSFVPPLVYAMLGSSKDLAVGTVAVGSLLMAAMLSKEVSPTQNPKLYLQLAITSTFFAGVFQTSLGLLRWLFCYIVKEKKWLKKRDMCVLNSFLIYNLWRVNFLIVFFFCDEIFN